MNTKDFKKVWLVMHCEIWSAEPYFVDELVDYVASSLELAEKYIENVHIFNDSWWQIAECPVNEDLFEEGVILTRYYGNKGKKLKYKPDKRALKAFLKSYPKGVKE